MNKYVIFREMLDYLEHIADVTDADLNYCGNSIRIEGDTEEQTIIIEVTIRNKEGEKDA
jgi:aspartate 1-decarboxylase